MNFRKMLESLETFVTTAEDRVAGFELLLEQERQKIDDAKSAIERVKALIDAGSTNVSLPMPASLVTVRPTLKRINHRASHVGVARPTHVFAYGDLTKWVYEYAQRHGGVVVVQEMVKEFVTTTLHDEHAKSPPATRLFGVVTACADFERIQPGVYRCKVYEDAPIPLRAVNGQED